jgi:hypothetical protein
MDCELPIIVIKPLVFMYSVTDSQIKDIRGCQAEELEHGIVLL